MSLTIFFLFSLANIKEAIRVLGSEKCGLQHEIADKKVKIDGFSSKIKTGLESNDESKKSREASELMSPSNIGLNSPKVELEKLLDFCK